MNLSLENKRVLITGSSRGIGLSIAREFLREGALVALNGRNKNTLQVAKNMLSKEFASRKIFTLNGDFTNPKIIVRELTRQRKIWNGLDILVLNLGSGSSHSQLLPDELEWQRVISLNLVGAVSVLRVAEPYLLKGHLPNVIFIGSIAGLETLGAPVPYGAAKAALRHAMKAFSRFLPKKGVRVNMVMPGNIFFKGGTWDRAVNVNRKVVFKMLANEVPLGRFGTPEEVASAVVFLASEKAAFINGACLVVDGGQTRV